MSIHQRLPHFVKVALNPVMKKRGNPPSDPPGPKPVKQGDHRSTGPRQRGR